MAWIPPGPTRLGSDEFHPEEAPARTVDVAGFWIDAHEVTNAQYAAFVAATGYVTVAERNGAGSAVFVMPSSVAGLENIGQWWRLDPTATWRAPQGAGVTVADWERLPVVHVTAADALAYARWRGADLPSEAEWERAARGGIPDAAYVWGDDPRPGGKPGANHWQGLFPVLDAGEDGYRGVAPAGCFAPNGYGLHDMAGNVWELVSDLWPMTAGPATEGAHIIKGGSYLCADNFCLRYRPAARQPADPGMGASHIGFRTVWRGPGPTASPPQGSPAH